VQAKVLRLLQNREIQRVGADAVQHVDVRIIAATNRHLPAMVAEKTFREDIYYRFAMVEIHLPRLIDRKEDVPLLQRAFVAQFSERYGKPMLRLTRRADLLLARYTWPGNVRELENALDYACMMAQGNTIDIHDFPEKLRAMAAALVETSDSPVLPLEAMERQYITQVLERFQGNRRRAADALGISRSTMYRILPATDTAE
jgi:transcriptional regulator with PAS, ATPase and Fis domain